MDMEQQHQRGGESEVCEEGGTIVMEINQEQQQKQQKQPRWQNPISSILSHLFGFLRHVQIQSNRRRTEEGSSTSSSETAFDVSSSSSTSPETEAEEQMQVVSVVKFPKIHPAFPSLKLDPEEAPRDTTTSAFWQVSALGTIIILRWAWARWKERTPRNESSSDEQPFPNYD